MENIKEKLINVWKTYETRKLAKIFEEYMKSIGAIKLDRKNNLHENTYLIDGKSTNWNRVECYFQKEGWRCSHENLGLTLRKRAGSYFIIEKKGIRAFECDYSGIRHYEEDLLNEIIKENQPLFDVLYK